MVQMIDSEYLEAIGGKAQLDKQIELFQIALAEHAMTVNVPAPTAHSAVEQIVRHHGGEYEIVEAPPPPTEPEPEPQPVTIYDVRQHCRERIYMVLDEEEQRNSLARMQLNGPTEADRVNWAEIDRLKTRYQAIKAIDPLPEDFRDDRHWAG